MIHLITGCRPRSRATTRAAGDGREPVLAAGRAEPGSLRRYVPGPTGCRWTGVQLRIGGVLRTLATLWRTAGRRRARPARRAPVLAAIAAGLGLGGNESYPGVFQPYGGFPDGVRVKTGTSRCWTCRDRVEGKADLINEMVVCWCIDNVVCPCRRFERMGEVRRRLNRQRPT